MHYSSVLSVIASLVLIETYWNVNNFEVAAHKDVMAVLIETYWNVNR